MLKGDVNLDGIVNEKDVMDLQKAIKKIIRPSRYNFEAFDVDGNMVLNRKDVAALQRTLRKCIPGDADGDGELSDNDVEMIQKEIAELVHLKGRNLKNADYNKDGRVNMLDVVDLQRHLAKISFKMQSETLKRILDEINKNMTYGTGGSSLKAVQMAAKLLDWGTDAELTKKETKDVVTEWMAAKKSNDFQAKMKLVDAAYKELLTKKAVNLLRDAGCEDASYPWSDGAVKAVKYIMEAVGLR